MSGGLARSSMVAAKAVEKTHHAVKDKDMGERGKVNLLWRITIAILCNVPNTHLQACMWYLTYTIRILIIYTQLKGYLRCHAQHS